jgi:hypothetical protein
MWRPAHGATTRPGPSRPASGYGRPIGRPEPRSEALVERRAVERALEPSMFALPPAPVDAEAEASAVTP